MRLPPLRLTGTGLIAAIGGGLAGVLLSMLTLRHPPVTLAMGFLAPLPLMIATIGFGPLAGVLSLIAGSAFVALVDARLGYLIASGARPLAAVGFDIVLFLLTLGVPSLLLSTAARAPALARTTVSARPEERLLGRVVIVAGAFAAVLVSLAFVAVVVASGGYRAFDALLAGAIEMVWRSVPNRPTLPNGVDVGQFASQLAWLIPPLMSCAAVFFYVINLWLAARIAQTSGLLGTTWPDIPRHMRVPRAAAFLLAVSLGLSFVGGVPGLVCRVISFALVAALALQGLAVVHAVTRGKGSRLAVLIIVYLSMAALMPWPLLFWGIVGLLDTAFSFRDRQRPALIRKS